MNIALKKHQIIHALDKDTQEVRSISEVKNGYKCNCVCSFCKEELTARQGKIIAHSFAHRSGSDSRQCSESALHLSGKVLFGKEKYIDIENNHTIRTISKDAPYTTRGIYCSLKFRLDILDKVIEQDFDSIRPDIRLTVRLPTGEVETLLVEILVTHKIDDRKAKKINRLGKSCIEIDISKAMAVYQREALTSPDLTYENFLSSYINNPSNMSFVNLSDLLATYLLKNFWGKGKENNIFQNEEPLIFSERQVRNYGEFIEKLILKNCPLPNIAKIFGRKEKISIDNHFFDSQRAYTIGTTVVLETKSLAGFDKINIYRDIEDYIEHAHEERVIHILSNTPNNFPLFGSYIDGVIIARTVATINLLSAKINGKPLEDAITKGTLFLRRRAELDNLIKDCIINLRNPNSSKDISRIPELEAESVIAINKAIAMAVELPGLEQYEPKLKNILKEIQESNSSGRIDTMISSLLGNNESYLRGGFEEYISDTEKALSYSGADFKKVADERNVVDRLVVNILKLSSQIIKDHEKLDSLFDLRNSLVRNKRDIGPRHYIERIDNFIRLNPEKDFEYHLNYCKNVYNLNKFEDALNHLKSSLSTLAISVKYKDHEIFRKEALDILNMLNYFTTEHSVRSRYLAIQSECFSKI